MRLYLIQWKRETPAVLRGKEATIYVKNKKLYNNLTFQVRIYLIQWKRETPAVLRGKEATIAHWDSRRQRQCKQDYWTLSHDRSSNEKIATLKTARKQTHLCEVEINLFHEIRHSFAWKRRNGNKTESDLTHYRRQTTKARVVAGRATDKSRSFDRMLAPRAAAYRSAWKEHKKPAHVPPTPSPQDNAPR